MGVGTRVEAQPREQTLLSLVYVSSAVLLFSPGALLDLLQRARDKNRRFGVTGMLLYKAGTFMQVLEGSEVAVRHIYSLVERDPRHKSLHKLLHHQAKERQFSDWAMGFKNLDIINPPGLDGYSDFLNHPLDSDWFLQNPTRSQKLLLSFRKNM